MRPGRWPTDATDLITFSPAAGTVGNGTAVAGAGGDLAGGVETAAIVSNGGNVTLVATATGALSDGTGDSIPFTQITTAAAADFRATLLPAPVLTDATSATVPHRTDQQDHHAKMPSGRSAMPTPRRRRPARTAASAGITAS